MLVHLITPFGIAKDIHGEMIAAGADADTAEWRTAEARLVGMIHFH